MTRERLKKALGYTAIVFATVLWLAASVWFGGCAARTKNVTNLPPGVTLQQAQNWDAAVADLHKVASTVSTLRQAIVDLHGAQYEGAPVLSNEYYGEALRVIGNVDRMELSAEAILRQSPQNFSASARQQVGLYTQEILQQVQSLNAAGATGVKNPKSLQQINGLLADVISIVNLISAL